MEDEVDIHVHNVNSAYMYSFFAVYDGHGGQHASQYARKHLMNRITKQKLFWNDDDECVKKSIRKGFLSTHADMSKIIDKWPRTRGGYPSTAGTTCSVVFITNNGKVYIGHVGDSAIVLGVRDEVDGSLKANCLTVFHKPDTPEEKKRIEESGGQVMDREGVSRVVWNRPKAPHTTGPTTAASTQFQCIPFLAMARSLGDFWSYNMNTGKYVVSPDPDVCSLQLDLACHKCLILATDGLWDMIPPQEAMDLITEYINSPHSNPEHSPASLLAQTALERWSDRGHRADNTSVIVIKL
jgi:protein phosphatase 1D